MKTLESFLNRTTMYRLVLYGLGIIAAAAFILSAFGVLSLSVISLATSLTLLLASTVTAEFVFSRMYGTTTSVESIWITALILFLTIAPPATAAEIGVVAIAGALAIVSKYVLRLNKKHIFNPAALALVVVSLAGSGLASWWVGTPYLLPVVAVVGFLIVRKIHRFDALLSFAATSVGITTLLSVLQGFSITSALSMLVLSGPLVFFSTIMLTEPLTMPPTKNLRIVYGLMVGGLYASQFHLGLLYATPHLALILGNVYSYIVSSKEKLLLKLQSVEQLSANVYEFVFNPNQRLAFAAGQYLEWTLPHASPDNGGNRRYFTISSSPAKREVRVGVRIDQDASSFKTAMLNMKKGDGLVATSLSGDFVLPEEVQQKLLFIAGGVGITPFASMLRYLIDIGQRRDIVLFYVASKEEDLAYRPLLEEAARIIGLNAISVTGKRLNKEMLQQYVPDSTNRKSYISGPDAMVKSCKDLLVSLGVARGNIKTDYFTGFSTV